MARLSCHRVRANEVRLWLSLIAYNLGNLWRRLAPPAPIGKWSLTGLQQRLAKTGGRLIKHARYYWLLLAEGHLNAAALREHAAEDRGAAVAGGIGQVRSAADFDDDVVAEGNVSAKLNGQMIFLAVAGPPDVKPSPLRTTKNTVDRNRLKPCRERSFDLYGELKSERQNGNPS